MQLVVTYGNKCNICGGIACATKTPHCTNVQGLGNLFQKSVRGWLAVQVYRLALKKPKWFSLKMPQVPLFSGTERLSPIPSR